MLRAALKMTMRWAIGGKLIKRNPKYPEEKNRSSNFSTIQHGLTYARTLADVVKGRRLSPSDSQLPKLTSLQKVNS
jgi:hypothetical protein